MPRKRRQPSPTGIYHWIVRGMNRKKIFHSTPDYECFLSLIREHKSTHEVLVYHYCLMTNHVHLLLQAPNLERLAQFSQVLQRRYAYYYCKVYQWQGSVFQRGYKSFPIDKESYLLECARSPEYLALSDDPKTRQELYGDYVSTTRVQEEMYERGLLTV